MILLLIQSLIFINPVYAKPPDEPQITQQDLQIRQECLAAVKSDNVDYNKCIAEAGRRAYEQRQQEARQIAAEAMNAINQPQQSPQVEINVCKPSEALKACQIASKRAALVNNASAPDVEREAELQNCLGECNSSNLLVLSKYLGGCGESAKVQITQMQVIRNNCGQGVATADDEHSPEQQKPVNTVVESVKGFFGYGDKPTPTLTDQARMFGLSAGFGAVESETTSFATSQKTHLSQGVDYVRIQDRSGNEVMRYQSTDGSMHDSFEAAAARSQQAVVVSKLPPPAGNLFNVTPIAERAAERADVDVDVSENYDDAIQRQARLARDGNTTGATTGENNGGGLNAGAVNSGSNNGGGTSGGGGSGGDSREVAGGNSSGDYPRSNQPIYQQAGAPGAFLQNSLNNPIGAANSYSSPVSASDVSEVSRGGSGSSSSGDSGSGSGPAFKGSGRGLSPLGNNAVVAPPKTAGTTTPEVADISAAGAGRLSAGGFAAAGTGFEGRRVAAVSPSSFGGSGITIPTSDSFYKTPGSDPIKSRSRIVKANPNCRPTKTRPCTMRRITIAGKGSSGGMNCDGNPQCILKLTGKIKPSSLSASGEPETGARSVRGRGVASVSTAKRATEFPVGVRRGGLEDIVQYMQNIGAAHMQLDHEGMLVTDH